MQLEDTVITYKPVSVDMYILPTIDATAWTNYNISDAETVVDGLMRYGSYNYTSGGVNSSSAWSVSTCNQGSICFGSTCVNETCRGSTSLLNLSPCAYPANGISFARILVVSFRERSVAPAIVSLDVAAETNSASITLQLSDDGSAMCAVYADRISSSAPTVAEITLQNRQEASRNKLVSLKLGQLAALTSYTVFCATLSTDGVASSASQIASSAKIFTTKCCKIINVNILTPDTKNDGKFVPNSVLLAIEGPVSEDFTIQAYVKSRSTNTSQLLLYPSLLTIRRSTEKSRSEYLSFSGTKTPDNYEVMVSADVNATRIYKVEYDSQKVIVVLSSVYPSPPPQFVSVQFTNDGSQMIATFDAATDRLNQFGRFSCNLIFEFPDAEKSTCQWTSDQNVVITLDSSSNLIPYSLVNLLPDALRAKCVAANGNCTTWGRSPSLIVSILPPAAPVQPVVVVSAPSIISSCDEFLLDLTGSLGSGGRRWNETITITSVDPSVNTDSVNAFLKASYSVSRPISIPKGERYLSPGQAYTINIKLCNFLFSCSSKTVRFVVSRSQDIPSVSILGSPVRSVYVRDALVLRADAYVALCNGSKANTNISYSWSVVENTRDGGMLQRNNLLSISTDPAMFRLRGYSLAVGSTFEVSVRAALFGSPFFAEARSTIVVQSGKLIAAISGGNIQPILMSSTLVLDASGSYDEDYPIDKQGSSLLFSWSCVQTSPTFNQSCPLNIKQWRNRSFAEISPSPASFGTTSRIVLSVTDESFQRSATAEVNVVVVVGTSCSIKAVSSVVKFNTNLKLQLTGRIDSSVGGTAVWRVDQPSLDLAAAALVPASVSISDLDLASSLGSRSLGFALRSSSLQGGIDYTFSLSFFPIENSASVSTSIIVRTNGPPRPGSLQVTPSGLALSTAFEYSASEWMDDDLPLLYEFGYSIAPTTTASVVQTKSERAFGSTLLPGSSVANQTKEITMYVMIIDSLLATSSASKIVNVHTPAPISRENVFERMSALLETRFDSNSLKLANSVGLVAVNTVNCSAAPNCTALNRLPCSTIENTCGECASSAFLSTAPTGNSLCVRIEVGANRRLLTSNTFELSNNCSSASDCEGMFEECIAGLCTIPSKQCDLDCSGHGTCLAFEVGNRSKILQDCQLFDASCLVACECDANIYGSYCQYKAEDLLTTQDQRSKLLSQLESLVTLENADDMTVKGWSSSLNALLQIPDEISEHDVDRLLILIRKILNTISEQKLNTLSSMDIVYSIGAVLQMIMTHNLEVTINDIMELFSSVLVSDLTLGETMPPVLLDLLRMQTANVQTSSSTSGVEVILPSRGAEVYSGIAPISLELSTGGSASRDISIGLYSVSLEAIKNKDAVGDSVTAYLSGTVSNQSHAVVTVPIRRLDHVVSAAHYEINETFRLECTKGSGLIERSHVCASGDVVTLYCDGVESGTFEVPCPVQVGVPSCGSDDDVESGCEAIASTPGSITCQCPVFRNAITSAAASGTGQKSRESVHFIPMVKYMTLEFAATWSSADSLSLKTINKGRVAVISLSAIAVISLIGLLVAMGKEVFDGQSEKQKKSEGNKKKQVSSMSADEIGEVLEGALPRVFRSESHLALFLNSLVERHRWLNVVFVKSSSRPRPYRVIALINYVILVLFGNAITYQLTMSNASDCDYQTTEADCISVISPYSSSDSLCEWNNEQYQCIYKPVITKLSHIFMMTIVSAMFTLPLTIFHDFLINNVLCSKLVSESQASVLNSLRKSMTGDTEIKLYKLRASQHFDDLARKLSLFRTRLNGDSKAAFDEMWGTRAIYSNFLPSAVKSLILEDLVQVERDSALANAKQLALMEENNASSEPEKHLLGLFQIDIMPYITGKIVSSVQQRSLFFEHSKQYGMWRKALTMLYLVIVNAGLLFYILLFTLQQSGDRQVAWMVAFFTWLVIDVVLLSTMLIYVTDIFIPSMFISNLDNLRHRVVAALSLMKDRSLQNNYQPQLTFDASNYLYTSKRVAKEFEYLPTSKIILAFSTPWPRRSYAKDESLSGVVAVILLQVFTTCMELPQPLQETLFKMSMGTIAVSLSISDTAMSALGSTAYVIFIVGLVFAAYALGKIMSRIISRSDAERPTFCDKSVGLVSTLDEAESYVPSSSNPVLDLRRSSLLAGGSTASNLSSRRQSAELAIDTVRSIEQHIAATPKKRDINNEIFYDSPSEVSSLDAGDATEFTNAADTSKHSVPSQLQLPSTETMYEDRNFTLDSPVNFVPHSTAIRLQVDVRDVDDSNPYINESKRPRDSPVVNMGVKKQSFPDYHDHNGDVLNRNSVYPDTAQQTSVQLEIECDGAAVGETNITLQPTDESRNIAAAINQVDALTKIEPDTSYHTKAVSNKKTVIYIDQFELSSSDGSDLY